MGWSGFGEHVGPEDPRKPLDDQSRRSRCPPRTPSDLSWGDGHGLQRAEDVRNHRRHEPDVSFFDGPQDELLLTIHAPIQPPPVLRERAGSALPGHCRYSWTYAVRRCPPPTRSAGGGSLCAHLQVEGPSRSLLDLATVMPVPATLTEFCGLPALQYLLGLVSSKVRCPSRTASPRDAVLCRVTASVFHAEGGVELRRLVRGLPSTVIRAGRASTGRAARARVGEGVVGGEVVDVPDEQTGFWKGNHPPSSFGV